MLKQISTFLYDIRRLKCNVILTSKAKEVWEVSPIKDGGDPKLHKAEGKWAPQVHYITPYWVDMLLMQKTTYRKGKNTRIAECKGSRAGIPVDQEIEKPNFAKICKLVETLKPILDW